MIHDPDFVLKEGMMLRVHVCRNGSDENDRDVLHYSPSWAVTRTEDVVRNGVYVVWLVGGAGDMDAVGCYDDFDIVPEDEWPDEVCVAMAKRALLGDEQ